MHVTAASRRAELGSELADRLDADFSTYEHERFPDGELYVQLGSLLDGPLVVLGDTRPNERVLETLIACDAGHEAGADEVLLAAPYLAYARQDRAFEPGEGVSSRALNAALSARADGLATVDVHAEQVLDHFEGPAVSEKAAPELATALGDREIALILAPDAGAREQARSIADRLDLPFDHLEKTRESSTEVSMAPKELDVEGDAVAIVDDIISTGGTMAEATGQLLDQGADRVVVAATHGVFVSGADKRLDDAGVDEILVTDTIPGDRSLVTAAGALERGVTRLLEG